ncbi:hypothetical protein [Streptomyces sp. NPDC086182]
MIKKLSNSRKPSGSDAARAAGITVEPGARKAHVHAMVKEP